MKGFASLCLFLFAAACDEAPSDTSPRDQIDDWEASMDVQFTNLGSLDECGLGPVQREIVDDFIDAAIACEPTRLSWQLDEMALTAFILPHEASRYTEPDEIDESDDVGPCGVAIFEHPANGEFDPATDRVDGWICDEIRLLDECPGIEVVDCTAIGSPFEAKDLNVDDSNVF